VCQWDPLLQDGYKIQGKSLQQLKVHTQGWMASINIDTLWAFFDLKHSSFLLWTTSSSLQKKHAMSINLLKITSLKICSQGCFPNDTGDQAS
jgi:hypothetical protein